MTRTISFDPSHDADQRRNEISLVMQALEPFKLKEMILKKDGFPDSDFDGDDADLALCDEMEIKYEKV